MDPQIPGFDQIDLTESFVLACDQTSDALIFSLELVLAPSHPLYRSPPAGIAYCYVNAKLIFPSLTQVLWERKTFQPFFDAADSVDYGNIDTFSLEAPGVFRLTGDWGEVQIWSKAPFVEIDAVSLE